MIGSADPVLEEKIMSDAINGSCLCGKIQFEVTGPFKSFFVCHCSRCRKATGSAHASNIFLSPEHIRWIKGEDQIRKFKLKSAKFFGRNFCPECGSPVPRVSEERNIALIPAGTLETDPDICPEKIIFWDDKAQWYEALSSTPRFATYPDT